MAGAVETWVGLLDGPETGAGVELKTWAGANTETGGGGGRVDIETSALLGAAETEAGVGLEI